MSQIILQEISSFSGQYPEIRQRADFQVDDDDPQPVFMTLPIGKAGSTSKNGRLYDRDFYAELVRQVNESPDPITGIVGHPNPDAVSWEVNIPSLEWVGATLDEQGVAWGKAYIYPEEDKLRKTIIRAKKRNGKVATSIWGDAVMDGQRATRPHIKRIDYADPDKAGVEATIATPVLTQEMDEDNPMPTDNNELISELRSDRDQARQTISELQAQVNELQGKLTPLEPKWQQLQEMAGGTDPVQFVTELIAERDTLRKAALDLAINEIISEQVELEAARPLIRTMVGPVENRSDATRRVSELLNDETVQQTLQALALAQSGGRVFVGEQRSRDGIDLDPSPEALARAKQLYGL